MTPREPGRLRVPPWGSIEIRQVDQWMLDAFRAKDAIILCSKSFFDSLKERLPEVTQADAAKKHWPYCALNHGGTACDMGPDCGVAHVAGEGVKG